MPVANFEGVVTPETTVFGDGSSSIFGLVRRHLSGLVNLAVTKANEHLTYKVGLLARLRKRLNSLLSSSLQHVGFGQGLQNDTVRHEVELAVNEATKELNITESNSTFKEVLTDTLDQQIELDALGRIFNATSRTLQDPDFFHKMPLKDETLFVALVCMAIILPIIFATLLGIFFYKRRQENVERQQEMLLREQPEFSMDEYSAGEPSDRNEDDVPDLNLKLA